MSIRIAFVLTETAALPSAEAVLAEHTTLSPEGPSLELIEGDDKTVSFSLERMTVVAAAMPAPVPDGEAEDAARFSLGSMGTGWQLGPHAAHVLVTLLADEVSPDDLQEFTIAVAAVALAANAVGVYWGEGHVTHAPRFFADTALEAPLMAWNGVSVANEGPERLSFLTLGMRQLGLPDMMVGAPRGAGNDAVSFLFEVLRYMVSRGEPLPDGDTIGRTAEEKLQVSYGASPANPEQKVFRVDLP